MNNKKLAILGIIAAVMLAWAIVQSKVSNVSRKVSAGSTYLVSGVDINQIGSIVIKSSDKTLTLKRQSGKYVVVNKDNYPALTGKINKLITDCLEIEVSSQIITEDSKNHKDLGVSDDNAQLIVKFLKPDGNELFGFIVGNTKENGNGTYMRLTSSDKVYVAEDYPIIDIEPINYIKTQIAALTKIDTAEVTVNTTNSKYTLKPVTDSEDLELMDMPEGKKINQSEAKGVFTALSNLSFTDVMKRTSDFVFDKHYICRLYNTTEFTFDIATKDGMTYVSCRAVFIEGRPESIRRDESEEELKQKEEKLLLDDKANDFTTRHINWVYEIPSASAKYMTMELSELLEDADDSVETDVLDTIDPNEIFDSISQENLLQN